MDVGKTVEQAQIDWRGLRVDDLAHQQPLFVFDRKLIRNRPEFPEGERKQESDGANR